MTTLIEAVAGDIGDTRNVSLLGVVNLTAAASVVSHVKYAGTTDTLTAAIDGDGSAGTITVDLGTLVGHWLPAGPAVGNWQIEHQVTFNDGSILTWPNDDDSPDYLPVRAQIL